MITEQDFSIGAERSRREVQTTNRLLNELMVAVAIGLLIGTSLVLAFVTAPQWGPSVDYFFDRVARWLLY